jgi:hypothetical protein
MSKVKVYDIETFFNCFTATFRDAKSDEKWSFVIHDLRDDRQALFDFLLGEELMLVGFNSLRFDYPVLHWMLNNKERLMRLSADAAAKAIYKEAQKLIIEERREIPKQWRKIPQCDVYRIHHFDNKAKFTSLKWVQIGLKWKNVQDMPFHHTHVVSSLDEIELILEYNDNDVLSTKELYGKTRRHIDMRKALKEKYGVDLLNANDPKVGKDLILKFIADKKGMTVWELKQLGTKRTYVDLSECINPNIKFNSLAFQKVHSGMLGKVIHETNGELKLKGKFKMQAIFAGMKYKFGLGGLHGCLKSGIWRSDANFDIMSCDVASYYPHIAMRMGFYPEHLGVDFCEVYEWVYNERKNYPKKTPENEGLKLGLNGTFGDTNNVHSPYYDPKFTMQITCNGQLMLASLCEEIVSKRAGVILMANTDGIEVRVPIEKRELYKQICLDWENKWKMPLEHKRYKVLATRDVNNYIGIFEDGDIKCKGEYEVDKELHKDPSMKIVPLAVREAIVSDAPVDQKHQIIKRVIEQCNDPYEFMIAKRAKGSGEGESWFECRRADSSRKLGKTNRYVVSGMSGEYLFKVYDTGEEEKVSSGRPITLLNKIDDTILEKLDIDKNYYVMEANRLLFPLLELQQTLAF